MSEAAQGGRPLSVLEVIRKSSDFFAARGIESPRLNAELLVGHSLGLKRMQLYLQFERMLGEPELAKIRQLVRRRGLGEPLQYVLGEVEFHGLKLKADRRALIPRPETEWMVHTVVERAGTTHPGAVLDLGTGTGAIALALATAWPGACVTAVDSSAEALALAMENAQALGLGARVSLIQSDWFSQLPAGARFDLVIANPPYLSAKETAAASPEVREHEPAEALTAGDEGLADLLKILREAPAFLVDGGWMALETGIDQHAQLQFAARECGWARFESVRDLAGRDRCIMVWK